jgi:hypothetical protein
MLDPGAASAKAPKAEPAGLVYNSGCMLPRINTLFTLPALCDLGPDALYARKKLRLAIECGQHDMAPLPPLRVIAVVMDDKAPDTVVVRLNSAHRPKANSPHRHPKHLRRSTEAHQQQAISKRETRVPVAVPTQSPQFRFGYRLVDGA